MASVQYLCKQYQHKQASDCYRKQRIVYSRTVRFRQIVSSVQEENYSFYRQRNGLTTRRCGIGSRPREAKDKRKRKIIRSCLRVENNMERKFRVMPKITGALGTALKIREARRDELKLKTQRITEIVQTM